MIKIDDGPEPYSRGAVAESEEQTVVVYILIGTELVDNVALMNAARRAEQRDDLRFDTQFIRAGDDLVWWRPPR